MASKPTRNNGSSPTNLSPSRPIRNSCSTSAAGRSTHGSNVIGGSKKGTSSSSSPIGGRPGLTPKTQRKELAPVQNSNTPQGSPKINNNTTKKTSSTSSSTSVSRKNSSKNNNINKRSSTGGGSSARPSSHSAGGGQSSTQNTIPPTIKLREETKFDGLWEVKTIDNGLIRLPTQCLENLISKEGIEKYYEVEPKPVASGGISSTVRKCVHRETGITYAAKFSSRLRSNGYAMVDSTIEILHEIAVLSVCMDSNKIVHLKDVFQTANEIILVLEYAPGGDFQSVLDEDMVPFEEDVQGFLRQILEALDFIHDRNIAHLDIKPQNIVLMGQFPNCEIKLCDLDVARVIQEDEDFKEIIGTPDYVAPEILEWKPITLAADIWSLGVCTYVLLTGFSPFGGDTDEETYINIHQAALDFPPELFEGVSDMAKEFISECLVKDPKKRPTIKQCLAHPWLATEEEPPSPSPLMLKIPTPDLSEPVHKSSHGHGSGSSGSLGVGHHGPSGSRRSCQTCRDKITERKRYLSKSREAIFEKVNQSKLKKSLSKSRERLPVCGLTLSKSRDNLGLGLQDNLYPGGQTKVMSRQQNKMYGFCKSLSKSQEVISAALGGVPMKRMINGAVSDISHALKQQHQQLAAAQGSHELPSPSIDYIFLPTGSGILVPQTELMKINSGSLQVLPLTESGRSTPASQASVATVQDLPMSQAAEVIVSNSSNVVVVTSPPHSSSAANLVETPLIEVSEEEEFDFKSDNAPSQHSSSSTLNGGSVSSSSTSTVSSSSERASSVSKDIKESQNYEKQKQSKKINNNNHHKIKRRSSETSTSNPLELELRNVKSSSSSVMSNIMTTVTSPILKETASVGIQVNLIQADALGIVAHGLMPGQHAQVLVPTSEDTSAPVSTTFPSQSSPRLTKKLAHLAQEPEEINLERHLLRNNKSNYESKTLPRRKSSNDVARLMKQSSMEEKPAPFRRGYTHDQMLGLDQKSTPAWREEINKIRSQKPFKISELIGTFDKRGQENQENNINNELSGANDISNNTTQTNSAVVELAALKKMRRNSLQIHFDPSDQLIKTAEDIENKKKEALLKTQRRKSTPTLLSNANLETMKIQDQIVDILKTASEKETDSNNPADDNTNENTEEKKDEEKPESKKDQQHLTKSKQTADENQQQLRTKSVPLMHTPQKNWDYFESFDHPKAISDRKLQQLKAKFSRRSRTEGNLTNAHSLCHPGHSEQHQNKSHVKAVSSIKEENEDLTSPDSEISSSNSKPMLTDRSKSVPVSLGSQNLSTSLAPALSIDPLTGVCLAPSHTHCASSVPTTTGSAAPSTVSEASSDMEIVLEDLGGIRQTQSRRVSTDSGEESADSSSRRSSRSSIQQRRRSTYLSDIYEQQKLQQGVSASEPDHHGSHHADDEIAVDTIVEVMIDPLTGKINTIEEKKPRRLSVEIMNNANTIIASDQTTTTTVNGGGQTSLGSISATRSGGPVDQGIPDDGFISLPHTPTDMGLLLDPKLKIAANNNTGSSISSTASTNSASTSQLADVGISLTSSEETLTTSIGGQNVMKKANSLEACDAGLDLNQSSMSNKNSNRPASVAASSTTTNTFVRAAREKFSSEKIPNSGTTTTRKMSASGSTETTDSSVTTMPLLTNRRQSSPMIRPSSS